MKIRKRIAIILVIVEALTYLLFSLDSPTAFSYLLQAVPALLYVLVLFVAIKIPRLGGILLCLLAVAAFVFFHLYQSWHIAGIAMFVLLPLIAAVLFMTSVRKRKIRRRVNM